MSCLLPYFLRKGFTLNFDFICSAGLTVQWTPGSLLSPLPQCWVYRRKWPYLTFYTGTGDLNLLSAFTANISSTEPSHGWAGSMNDKEKGMVTGEGINIHLSLCSLTVDAMGSAASHSCCQDSLPSALQ